MTEFIAIATSFPTMIFSAGLLAVVVFWLLAIIGLVDIEIGSIDIDIDADVDASGFGVIAGFLNRWGLAGIPITVVVSMLLLLSWMFCYFGSAYLLPLLPGSILKFLGGMALIGACLMVALPITAASLKPMAPMFKGAQATTRKELIGKRCEVRSGEVTDTFGQGLIDDGGAGLLMDIRAEVPNQIKRGDAVAIVAYDETAGTYKVMPEDDFMRL